ncbi:hypothetical protein [Wolbachia endosymbiont (group A) of Anthophora plumipes]|uniref:hypothetical protein n=1 Tax=Wolbachia endosymbiont (group A) of Anthophora plumipes TaxID=3066194 RepID=UPI00334211A3
MAEGNLINLVQLNLTRNKIGKKGAKVLANGKFENLEQLNLENNNIGDEGAKALANNNLTKLEYLSLKDNYIRNEGAKALANGNFTKLQHLILTEGVGDEVRKELEAKLTNCIVVVDYRNRNLPFSPENNSKYYVCGGKAVGLFLGLSIAYLAGAATLAPAIVAVAVFIAATVVGALVGYGIGKFCEKVSEEKQNDPDMSMCTAIKNVLIPECLIHKVGI